MRDALLLMLLAAGSPAHAGALRQEGEARDASGARLLYRETHYVLDAPAAERWVLYRCPDGRPFARKRVRGGGLAPDFAYEDGRDGYVEGVRSDGTRRTAYAGRPGAAVTSLPEAPADAVIDAGFDAAVRARWGELMAGRVVRFRFLVPSRQRFLPVRVRRVAALAWQGQRAERLRMSLDAWFGFAVPDVDLVYARDGGRLLEFHGTGNVRDARGRYPQVRITFTSPPVAATPVDLAAVGRAPLDGRCHL
jgi:hypothetical protein